MDVIVTPAKGGTVWQLTDLLGRSMGRITASAPHRFIIHAEGNGSETVAAIQQGPHASLDAALAEIERHTRAAVEILAKISFRRRPTIQLVSRVSYIYCEMIYMFYR